MRPVRQRSGERYVILARPNTPPAPSSSASGVARAAKRCLMPLLGGVWVRSEGWRGKPEKGRTRTQLLQ